MNNDRRAFTAALAAALAACSPLIHAQAPAWPTKPVKLIVPSAAGTAPDIIARLIGAKLTSIWNQPVVVENRPGGGGVIALTTAKNAPKDSHSFVFAASSAFAVQPYMFKSPNVDFWRDFGPVAMIGMSPMMLAVAADAPYDSLADLARAAAKAPDELVVATTTSYSIPHLAAFLVAEAAGIRWRVVPFLRGGEHLAAVVNKDAQVIIDGVPPLDAMIAGGKLKPLALFYDSRVSRRQNLPVAAETFPSLVVNGWFGVAAVLGTETAAIDRANRAIATVLEMPEVIERLDTLGVYPRAMTPAAFGAFWKEERTRWGKVLQSIGATPVQQ